MLVSRQASQLRTFIHEHQDVILIDPIELVDQTAAQLLDGRHVEMVYHGGGARNGIGKNLRHSGQEIGQKPAGRVVFFLQGQPGVRFVQVLQPTAHQDGLAISGRGRDERQVLLPPAVHFCE